jgi:uncharacterized protein (DUF697 family)
MSQRRLSPGGAISTVGSVRNFVGLIREMSFDEERQQAERMPRILVIAPTEEIGRQIGALLVGSENSAAVSAWTLDTAGRNTDAYDVIIVNDPNSNATFRKARETAGSNSRRLFDLAQADVSNGSWAAGLRERIANALPDLAPALGRWFPVIRPAATKAVIDETARVNAQFALVSNLPSAIPIVGALAAVGADFFILTKNQVMMVFKLAAIHGRDLSDQWGIIRELVPVVGAGFFWRTLAREAASFLPFMAGTVPKVAIAFTGTVAAGRAADFYYRSGKKPNREQLQAFYSQAAETLKRIPLPVGRDNGAKGVQPPVSPGSEVKTQDSYPAN